MIFIISFIHSFVRTVPTKHGLDDTLIKMNCFVSKFKEKNPKKTEKMPCALKLIPYYFSVT